MSYEHVRLYQFRNLQDGIVETAAPQVFLRGENGQGKSNFLESLYLLSYGGSFRTRRDAEMCRTGSTEMAVVGRIQNDSGRHTADVRYQEGKKSIVLDESTVSDRRDMISLNPSVVFRHDDMGFVSGAPEMQRWFVDQTLSMNRPVYVDDLRRYRLILKNRNHAIKNEQYELLDIYDQELAEAGLLIQERRREVVEAFNTVFSEDFRAISGLDSLLELSYRPSWRGAQTVDDVVEDLQSRREQEKNLRTTTSGPHRDRILYRYDDRDFLQVASTGQTRLVALILRVAQARFYAKRSGRDPVLLLDDVLLELDPVRRTRFIERLPDQGQRVFTFLPGEPYEAYRNDDTMVYDVEDGRLRRE